MTRSSFFTILALFVPIPVSVLLIGAVAAYAGFCVAVMIGFWRIRRTELPDPPDEWPSVSVIVAARDEADRIEACIDRILDCDYPDDRLEVIVVDDFSTDGTASRVRDMQPAGVGEGTDAEAEGSAVRLLQMEDLHPANGGHKPEAVARGVEAATGEVLLTTDADCRVKPGWIRSMVHRCTPDTPFVAGAVRYRYAHRYFERLQALAFAGLVAFGAGTLGLGLPTYCNSANVAFRRDVLDDVPGDANGGGAAGDELLLQHVAYGTHRSVAFNADPNAVVTTEPAPSFDAYVHQQARWASMGARYPFALPRLLVVGMWAVHPILLAALLVALALPAWRQPALGALLAKMGADLLLAVPFTKHFDQGDLVRSTVATELLLLVVVPFVGLLGRFGSVEWKGRPL